MNADVEVGGGDAPQCNSVFLFLSTVVLLSVKLCDSRFDYLNPRSSFS